MPDDLTTQFSADFEDAGLGLELTTPEADKRDIKRVFQTKVVHLLTSGDWAMKIVVNVLTIFYLGAEANFAAELIRELSNNKEKLVSKGPVWQGKVQESTVGNWLKYLLAKIEKEGIISPVVRAQFFTADKELAKLSADEKKVIEKLFKLYEAIHDFSANVRKKKLAEIYIFPFSDEELEKANEFLAKYAGKMPGERLRSQDAAQAEEQAEENEETLRQGAVQENEKQDIWDIYMGKPEESQAIKKEYDLVAQKTSEQILDYFETALTSLDKTKVLAGLEVLAEQNIIPKVFAENPRFQLLIQSYLKRHGLAVDKSQELIYFLRAVLEDRLAMPESEAARAGAYLANIFRENGQMEFSQIAYFDEQEHAFKWI